MQALRRHNQARAQRAFRGFCPDEPEYFNFGAITWDIAEAKRQIAARTGEPEVHDIPVAPLMGLAAMVYTDPERVAAIDPERSPPVILAPVGAGGERWHLLIDGWHRLKAAAERGEETIPGYVLTKDESDAAELDAMGRPKRPRRRNPRAQDVIDLYGGEPFPFKAGDTIIRVGGHWPHGALYVEEFVPTKDDAPLGVLVTPLSPSSGKRRHLWGTEWPYYRRVSEYEKLMAPWEPVEATATDPGREAPVFAQAWTQWAARGAESPRVIVAFDQAHLPRAMELAEDPEDGVFGNLDLPGSELVRLIRDRVGDGHLAWFERELDAVVTVNVVGVAPSDWARFRRWERRILPWVTGFPRAEIVRSLEIEGFVEIWPRIDGQDDAGRPLSLWRFLEYEWRTPDEWEEARASIVREEAQAAAEAAAEGWAP